jgi:DNA-binding IclR family transcriptional regulator
MSDSVDRPFRGRQPGVVNHALEILGAIAQAGPVVTAREISSRLHLSKATTYRILSHLVQEEYVVRSPDLTGYLLGARVVGFAELVAAQAQARPHQEETTLARTSSSRTNPPPGVELA